MPPTLVLRAHRRPRRIHLVLLVLAMLVALTGCGEITNLPGQQGRSPEQLLGDSAQALRDAKSYHVSSDTLEGVRETSFELDVIGNTATGTISGDKKWTLHIIMLGEVIYVWGKSYWEDQLGAAQAHQIGDRCMRVTPYNAKAKDAIQAFTRYADTKGYAEGLTQPNGTAVVDGTTTFAGRTAFSVSDGTSKVYIDAGKPSYPLHIEIRFGPGQGHTNFSKFNQVTQTLEAPTGCLDLAQMAGVDADPSASPSSASGTFSLPGASAGPSAAPTLP